MAWVPSSVPPNSGSLSIIVNRIRSGPFEGLFFWRTECRNGEINIADVTIAAANIGLSVRRRATAIEIADGQPHTAENGSRLEQRGGAEGA